MRNQEHILYGENDEEHQLPTVWVICGRCQGEGKSSAYLGAFTHDQMIEDPDFAAEYKRGGYDRACDECDGAGKLKEIDEEKIAPEILEAWRAQQTADAEIEAIHRQERLSEGAWRDIQNFGCLKES